MLNGILSRSENARPRLGRIFKLSSENYLIATPIFQDRETLESHARDSGILELSSFKLLSFQPNIFAEKRYAGLLKLERVEVAGLLKVLEEKLVVRFNGEYSTKQLSLNRFEDQEDRYLIRDQENNLLGIFHESTGTFLRSPDTIEKDSRGQLKELDKNAFRHGTITSFNVKGSNGIPDDTPSDKLRPMNLHGLLTKAQKLFSGKIR